MLITSIWEYFKDIVRVICYSIRLTLSCSGYMQLEGAGNGRMTLSIRYDVVYLSTEKWLLLCQCTHLFSMEIHSTESSCSLIQVHLIFILDFPAFPFNRFSITLLSKAFLFHLPNSFTVNCQETNGLQMENFVNIQIPPPLKKQLVDDCEFITHLGKVVLFYAVIKPLYSLRMFTVNKFVLRFCGTFINNY